MRRLFWISAAGGCLLSAILWAQLPGNTPPVPVKADGVAVTNAAADAAAATNAVDAIKGEWRAEDLYVYAHADWTLEINFLNLGTRSEGQRGRLLKANEPVKAVAKGDSLMTPLGLLKYYGEERQRPWDVTGWNFADRRKIKHSGGLAKKESGTPAAPGAPVAP